MKLYLLSFLLILFPFPKIFYAKVVGITDGNSIIILTKENRVIKIRLEGIDCPEHKQDFGQKAKQAKSILCFNKQIPFEKSGVGHYCHKTH